MIFIFKRLKQIGLWERVFPELDLTREVLYYLKAISKSKKQISHFFGAIDFNLMIILTLCHQANEKQVDAFLEKFQWPKAYRSALKKTLELKKNLPFLMESGDLPISSFDKLLRELPNEILVYLYLISNRSKQNLITKYLKTRQECVLTISGHDLKLLGIKPGPAFKKILDQVRAAKLDGIIQSRDHEIAFVKELMRKEGIKCHLEV